MKTAQIIGDKNKFAIHYRVTRAEYNYTPTNKMAICHLVIHNNLIGNADEECYLPTWIFNLTNSRNRIVENKHLLFPNEFENLSDREIFELILKANQLENEFHPDFLYLPQLDEKFWSNHKFTLDETVDNYIIYFYVKNDQLTFLIEDLTERSKSDDRRYKLFFYSIDFDLFVDTIDETTRFLLQQYSYLKENISTLDLR